MGEGISKWGAFSRKRLRERFITFASTVSNVCIRGCKRYPWRTHVFAFKVDQIGPGGCSALQGWLQCTAGAVAVHCIRLCSALPLFPQVRATIPASTCVHPCKYVNPFPLVFLLNLYFVELTLKVERGCNF